MLSGLKWAQREFANGFCSSPLWAREGTSASMQSWKESQLLRCSQKRELVYSLGPAQACDNSSHIIWNFIISFSLSWPLLLPHFASLSLLQSHPERTIHYNYIFPTDPRCATSVSKIDISDAVPQAVPAFHGISAAQLPLAWQDCAPQRCSILPSG